LQEFYQATGPTPLLESNQRSKTKEWLHLAANIDSEQKPRLSPD